MLKVSSVALAIGFHHLEEHGNREEVDEIRSNRQVRSSGEDLKGHRRRSCISRVIL